VVEAAVAQADPEVVFHLAAQPLVRLSYETPVETFATNVQGSVHVLDACRRAPNLRASWRSHRTRPMKTANGSGPIASDRWARHDPYSASKGAAELVIAAYRRSFSARAPLLARCARAMSSAAAIGRQTGTVPDIIRALIAGSAR
jgi:CDP-glucose 4,6-dehydratase